MGKRKSSGLLETLVKSVFQTGTTVRRQKDWLGRNQTVVRHHDTGKTKTYTHGAGFFGDITTTKTKINGTVIERGEIKKSLFLGTPVETANRTNGSNEVVTRKYGQGLFGDKMKTHVKDADGCSVGVGETKTSLLGGTRTRFMRHFKCNGCGQWVGSKDSHFRCQCGREWTR